LAVADEGDEGDEVDDGMMRHPSKYADGCLMM